MVKIYIIYIVVEKKIGNQTLEMRFYRYFVNEYTNTIYFYKKGDKIWNESG